MAKKKNEEITGDSDEGEFGEEPNFEDPDGFVDNVSDEGKFKVLSTFQYQKRC